MSEVPPAKEHARVGGMALANGLLVHGPSSWAVAVREADGQVTITSGPKPRLTIGPLGNVPVLRGALRLAEAIAVIPVARVRSPSARLAMEDPRMFLATGAAAALSAVARRRLGSVIGQEAIVAALGLVPSVWLLSRSQAATWHAVEHKNIAAYEDRGPDGVAWASTYAKEHTRCGSNLILPLMASTAVGNAIARRTRAGRSLGGRAGIAAIASGLAVELFAFASRNPERGVSRLLHRAGHELQAKFVTKEPNREDLAVGGAAIEALLRRESGRR